MKIEEVVEKIQYATSELYIPALVGIVEPRDASKVLAFLSSQLPLELYGVCNATIDFAPSNKYAASTFKKGKKI